MGFLPWHPKVARDCSSDDPFFVSGDDADGHRGAAGGNDAGIGGILFRVDFQRKKIETRADAFAHLGRMLADAAGKNQGVQAPERAGERANPFLGLGTNQRYGLGGADVGGFAREQFVHVRAGLRDTQETGFVVDHVMELLGGDLFGPPEIPGEAGIKVTGTGAHGNAGSRGKTHAGIDAFAVVHGGEAGAVSEMRNDDTTSRGLRAGSAGEFIHENFAGQTVETVAADAAGMIAPRNRQ